MLDRQLREIKERVLNPVALQIGKVAHPTTISLLGGGVGLAAGLAGWQGAYTLGLVLWAVNRFLDGIDGTIARLYKKSSDLGGYIDILIDFVVYAWIPVMLTLGRADSRILWLALAYMLSVFYINAASWIYLSSILEKRNQGAATQNETTTITMPVGLVEGTETVVMYGLFFLLPGQLPLLFAIMGTLVLITAGQRLVWALRHI